MVGSFLGIEFLIKKMALVSLLKPTFAMETGHPAEELQRNIVCEVSKNEAMRHDNQAKTWSAGMKKYYILLMLPIIVALLHAAVVIGFQGKGWMMKMFNYEVLLATTLSCYGFLRAMLSFKRGEYLRRGWCFMLFAALILLLSSFYYRFILGTSVTNHIGLVFAGIALTVANMIMLIGIWVLSRTWQSAGLEFLVSRTKVRLVMASAVAIGLLFAGPTVWYGFWDLLKGNINGDMVSMIVSGISEVIALCIIAPMLLTAHALYEGPLRWPWVFLAATVLCWLGTDASFSWNSILGWSDTVSTTIRQMFQLAASIFGFSSGMAQYYVQRDIRSNPPVSE